MRELTDRALNVAEVKDATYADVRIVQRKMQGIVVKNGKVGVLSQDESQGFGVRIILKHLQYVDEAGANHRITTDANAVAEPCAACCECEDDFVHRRARSSGDAHGARRRNMPRDNTYLDPARREYAGAMGTHETHTALIDVGAHLQHVVHRDTFSDADDQRNASVCSLQDGIDSEASRHVHDRCVGLGVGQGLVDCVENGHHAITGPQASFARCDARHDLSLAGLQRA